MADALPELNDDLGYKCPRCNHPLDLSTVDESEYENDMWEYITDINDSDPCFPLGEYICKTPVSIDCTCERCECDGLVTVIAEVAATLVQYEVQAYEECIPKSEIDEDVYFRKWLPSSESPDIKLSTAKHKDIPPDDDDDDDDESHITLRIICKTRMLNGLCFIAVDEQENRLLRPIFNTEQYKCCWPRNDITARMRVRSLVQFQVYHHPDHPEAFQTPFPHRNEDLIVDQDPTIRRANDIEWSPAALRGLSKANIYDIFPEDMVLENKYISKGEDCPSAGILLAQQADVEVYQDINNKPRVRISHGELNFDFPLTAKKYYNPQDAECQRFISGPIKRP